MTRPRPTPRLPGLTLTTCAVVVASNGGCVQRRLSIVTDPPGALLHLNDQEIGRTPLEVPFEFYGTYDVRLSRPGYAPLWTTAEARAPWWETPPLDLFADWVSDAEVVIPWHFKMEALKEPDDAGTDALIDRARVLEQRPAQAP